MNPPTNKERRRLEAALEMRRQSIARLEACNCEYPIVRLRNGSGHHGTCPAHEMWEASRVAGLS